ncbi:hypothetical protein BJV82DRAFT_629000 [Fennellomyces sp. T-0311]|nr:hypothetical protein BJV82DRAFT_629000 [Fennellomyces sp. T-0311]
MSYNRNTSGNTSNSADWQYSGAQVDPRTNEQASDYNDALNNPTTQSGYNTSSYGQQQTPTTGYNTRSSGHKDTTGYSGTQSTGNYGSNPTQTSSGGYGSNQYGSGQQYGSQQQPTSGQGFGSQQQSYGQDTSGFDASTQGNPTMGDKVKGGFEKFTGKMKGDSRQVAEGEARAKGYSTNLQ